MPNVSVPKSRMWTHKSGSVRGTVREDGPYSTRWLTRAARVPPDRGRSWIACIPPQITQPPDQIVPSGSNATLTVTTSAGTPPLHYAWFQGVKGDVRFPVGTDSPTVTVGPLTSEQQYFVNLTNACGSTNSETITVRVSKTRRRATAK